MQETRDVWSPPRILFRKLVTIPLAKEAADFRFLLPGEGLKRW